VNRLSPQERSTVPAEGASCRPAGQTPILIGGTGRTGKTLLTIALKDGPGQIAGFPLEGVFHTYLKRRFPFFMGQRPRLAWEYINRPRYMDAARTHVERPSKYLGPQTYTAIASLPQKIGHQIKLIGWILDRFAEAGGRQSWAAFDLHPEFRYAAYRRHICGLRLAVMRRDPRATIAANLFWRSYPDAPPDRRKRFLNALFLLNLSDAVTERLARKYPGSVVRFSFDALVKGDSEELRRVSEFFDAGIDAIRDAFAFEPHFAFDTARGTLGPDGQWTALLSDAEIAEIAEAERGPMRHPILGPLVRLGRHAPNQARALADFYLYPSHILLRQANAVRQILKDTRAGVDAANLAARTPDGARPFFVVSGSHGVGKTTTVELITRNLAARGHPVSGFHHRVKGSKIKSRSNNIGAATTAPIWKRALRRLTPKSLRGLRTGLRDARHYENILGTEIRAVQDRGEIVILDRYIYDQLVDTRLWSRPWYQVWPIARLCRRMPRPAMTFFLDDDPDQVHVRKPEMSASQIRGYQELMLRFLSQLQLPHLNIDLRDRDAEQVSAEIADIIDAQLKACAGVREA